MLDILTRIIIRNLPPAIITTPPEKSLRERNLLRAQERFHSMEEVYGPEFLAPPKIISTRSS